MSHNSSKLQSKQHVHFFLTLLPPRIISQQTSAYIFVRIMNDNCREPFPKYVQLTMSIPGTNVMHGEHYKAKLRIDDDDFDQPYCDALLH